MMKYCKLCGNCGHSIGFCTTDPVNIQIQADPGTRIVELFTEMDEWKVPEELKPSGKQNVFELKKSFPPGKHLFKFRVDRTEWRLSDKYPKVECKGYVNNVIEVHMKPGESVMVQSVEALSGKNPLARSSPFAVQILLNEMSLKEIANRLGIGSNELKISPSEIEVWGSWDGWKKGSPMSLFNDRNPKLQLFVFKTTLESGNYEYKFRLKGRWFIDPFRRSVGASDLPNHELILPPPQSSESGDKQLRIVSTKVTTQVYSHDNLLGCDLTGHTMTMIDGRLFIFGGLLRDTFTNNMFKVSFNPFKVKELKYLGQNAPTPIGFHMAIKYGEKLIIYGGYDSKSVSDQYHAYSILNNCWTAYKFENPIIREMYSVCYKEGTSRIYIFGGLYSHPDDEFEMYFDDIHVLFLNLMRFQCLTVKNAPIGRCRQTTAMIDWTAYMFGGCRNEGLRKVCFDDLFRINLFDEDNLEWTEIRPVGPKPPGRYGHCCVPFGAQLILYGGYFGSKKDDLFGDIWVFDTRKEAWTELHTDDDPALHKRAMTQACVMENSIIVFGGKLHKQNPLHDKLVRFTFGVEDDI